MFKPTEARTPDEYLAAISEPRRSEVRAIHKLIIKIAPGLTPHILSGMIGYGSYHYRYKSGREGDWALILLGSQKNYISLYVCALENEKYIAEEYKEQLPKASIGKSCIRFKKREDVDEQVIIEIIKKAQKVGGMGEVK